MTDTNPAIRSKFIQLIMAKSPEEKVLMGCSMFDAAKQIVKDSMRKNIPKGAPQYTKQEIFLRFYAMDFEESVKRKILDNL